MKAFVLLGISLLSYLYQPDNKERVIYYQGTAVNTTFEIPGEFLGLYTGQKAGYLKLNEDGTGDYKYDIFGMAPPSCERKSIELIWGFILDEKGEVIKNKRDYGYSYPILLKSTSSTSFQGCRKEVMKDFILKRGSTLHVSSSDDWEKPIE